MGDEQEKTAHAKDEPDVEAHQKRLTEDAPADKKDGGDDDAPDVEAHVRSRG